MENQKQPDAGALRDKYAAAFDAWIELYSGTDWGNNPTERGAMLAARLTLQQAKLDLVFRHSPPLGAAKDAPPADVTRDR